MLDQVHNTLYSFGDYCMWLIAGWSGGIGAWEAHQDCSNDVVCINCNRGQLSYICTYTMCNYVCALTLQKVPFQFHAI